MSTRTAPTTPDAAARPAAAPDAPGHGPAAVGAGRARLVLAGSITGASIVALDGMVLTVAQPTMQRDLNTGLAAIQWTSTGYLIAVAALLVFAGRLGDRYGHRRTFAVGVLGFAAASALIGLAPGIGWVIALRVLQGVFGALLQPATLGMLRLAYPPDRIAMPIAIRTAAIGLSAAAGPIVGGALATQFGWRAVFLLSVPPALAVGLIALAVRLPEPRPAAPVRLDLPGAALLALALLLLVHTLVALPGTGWTPVTWLGLLGAAAALAALARHERRTPGPLVPASVLRSPAVRAALALLVTASAAMFGALFLAGYYLQEVLGLDPLHSGLRALPLALAMVLGSPAAAVIARRHGPRRTAVPAAALITLGIALLSRLDPAATWWQTGVCFLLLGAGFGTVMVTATAVVVHRAPVETAGVAGGLQQTALNIGPTLGVAAATTLVSLRTPGPHWTPAAFGTAMGPALLALAALAAGGALAATRLPGRRTGAQVDRRARAQDG